MNKCILCGKGKSKEGHVVCSECYQKYREESVRALIGGKAITLVSWVKEEAEKRLQVLREEVEKSQEELQKLNTEVRDKAYSFVTLSLKGQRVPKEVFQEAFKEKKRQLWEEAGGNRLYSKHKQLEENVVNLEKFLTMAQNLSNKNP